MCSICNGVGRYTHSPYPGLITFEFCSCKDDMEGLARLEQEMKILREKIEAFKKEMSYGESLDG